MTTVISIARLARVEKSHMGTTSLSPIVTLANGQEVA
jgi:hypothetical protein